MGICYMMQYMDKLALSQATLFNIREDLVRCTAHERRNAIYRLTALLFIYLFFLGSQRTRVYLDIRYLLLRISRMESHQLLPHRASSTGQVCDDFGVRLGRCLDVPCGIEELWWFDGC